MRLDHNGLSCHPHHIKGREDVWWYEENAGMYLYWEPGHSTEVQHAVIPWSVLRRALARKDAPRPV